MVIYPALGLSKVILSISFGSLVGFSLGLLGGGGSVLTVPILVYIIGQEAHAATATSLAIVGSSALLGAFAHGRGGNVRIKSGAAFGVMATMGAVPGVWINRHVAGEAILFLFGFLMISVAVAMFRKNTKPQSASSSNLSGQNDALRYWVRLLAIALVVGLLSGFFGVGGGFLIVPALVLVGNFPAHQAVGTSLLVIVMAAGSGFLSHLHFGSVDVEIVGLFVIGGVAGVLFGTALSRRMAERKLTRAFGWLIIIVASYVIYNSIVSLL